MANEKENLETNRKGSNMEMIWKQLPSSRLLVEASLWSADFTCFAEEINRIDAFIDMYHIDVADGHFVPGFLFFADLVAALRPLTKRPFHVHLMTTHPLNHIADFVSAGANMITVHAENGTLAPAALEAVRNANIATGLAMGLYVQPETIEPYLERLNLVLVMGTPMSVKGVQPSNHVFDRIRQVKSMIRKAGLDDQVKVFADGGIREHTVPTLRASGADGVIAGSLAFKSTNLKDTFNWLHRLKMKNGFDK